MRLLPAILFFALVISVSLLISTGSYFQQVLVALLTSDASSIYEGTYGSLVQPFPDFAVWISSAFWWPFLLAAICISSAAFWTRTVKGFFIAVSSAAAVSLTVIDLTADIALNELVQSVIANFIGGVLLAAVLYSFLCSVSGLRVGLGLSCRPSQLAPVSVIVCGVLVNATLYFVFRTILHPTPVSLSLTVPAPFEGYYIQKSLSSEGCGLPKEQVESEVNCPIFEKHAAERQLASVSDTQFEVLGDFRPGRGVKVGLIGRPDPAAVQWRAANSALSTVRVFASQGCKQSELGSIRGVPLGPRAKEKLSISFPSDMSEISELTPDGSTRYKLVEESVRSFSVRASEEGSWDVGRFVSKADVELLVSPGGDSSVGLTLVKAPGDSGWNRQLVRVDSESSSSQYIFSGRDMVEPERKIGCKDSFETSGNVYGLDEASLNLVIDIHSPAQIRHQDFRNRDVVSIPQFNGWVTARGVSTDEIEQLVSAGSLGFLQVGGLPTSLNIDGHEQSPKARTSFTMYGELYGGVRDGEFVISGKADAFYLNQQRMNLTRWEKTELNLRLLLIGALPAFALLLRRRLIIELGSNRSGWFFMRK